MSKSTIRITKEYKPDTAFERLGISRYSSRGMRDV